ncbi:hypothetical protein EV44_g1310 [Erysiphe necator]|uniref:Uncharacterized protein n=1 Tax=Uncinula necator TaxID=52586 RepID=A0A0B1P8B1_UNCNE|nr:hypothetical protein EV44_g1310 [Erysiphe necator]
MSVSLDIFSSQSKPLEIQCLLSTLSKVYNGKPLQNYIFWVLNSQQKAVDRANLLDKLGIKSINRKRDLADVEKPATNVHIDQIKRSTNGLDILGLSGSETTTTEPDGSLGGSLSGSIGGPIGELISSSLGSGPVAGTVSGTVGEHTNGSVNGSVGQIAGSASGTLGDQADVLAGLAGSVAGSVAALLIGGGTGVSATPAGAKDVKSDTAQSGSTGALGTEKAQGNSNTSGAGGIGRIGALLTLVMLISTAASVW